ncbi:alpha/beta fold hydrolase [Arenibaculum pallidiluteum]|uniref:alpha/beta fold hydrolase n=1 Tax=Arenibaculum pallidiluteum TaxID=2812559 RepID=UPI001A97D315|nr:alpha/beta hydrolase [Arenibaculum pallidiluteum]
MTGTGAEPLALPGERSLLGLSPAGFHRIAYAEWGAPDAGRTVVCVHGLTRNGRDFDFLAAGLAGAGLRVLCPDMPGRGRSDWLADPNLYGLPQYMADSAALIARSGAAAVDWIGTSMGGLVGMMLAAQPNTPIRRLVLNDVGPFVPKTALERIAAYVGQDPRFPTIAALEAAMRTTYAPFGALTDAQWTHLARHEARPLPGGGYALGYDPRISVPIRSAPPQDVDLWAVWDRISCPVLAVRGASSDLLLPGTLAEMATRGPRARTHLVEDAGHAPALMADGQIAAIRDFLLEEPE